MSGMTAAVALSLLSPLVPSQGELRFGKDIRPILARHCLKCHGPDVQEGGLRLDQADGATRALESGNRAIVPGEPSQGELVRRVRSDDPDTRMPPPGEGEALTTDEISWLEQWIAAGAAWETHWAYLPPARPQVPTVANKAWPRNPIDNFVLAAIEREGLTVNEEASRETLLRRVTLDLIGLPPTPEERAAFLSDRSPDTYEKVVDRLLASPQFGVRQAIGWLDLARYADSDGYPHDSERTIWPYRDWVVDAMNADMPFDQFTLEQLAGDLLPNPTDDQLIATGFHRNTRITIEAGSDPETYRYEAVFDRVNTTAAVWLGTTLACAQCHNHKYDPFTQEDYYRLLAIFNNCAVETTTDEAGKMTNVSAKHAFFTQKQKEKRREIERRLAEATGEDERQKIQSELDGIKPTKTLVMREVTPPRPTFLLKRGSLLTPGPQVTPGVPAVLATPGPALGGGPSVEVVDRLDLARWLMRPDHPLVARVAMNRLWMAHFGQGIVATPDDFGTQAPLASNEPLLDWLATEFVAGDWRLKRMHRLIVTSATYRQSARATPDKLAKDPTNRWLARGERIRLPAEIVRDNALAIGGLLDLSLGGPSISAVSMGHGDKPISPYRRSLYVFWKRQALDETFQNLDAPSRDVSCARRVSTHSPLQALNLLNERVFLDAARGFANRIWESSDERIDQKIEFAFKAALGRSPRLEEAKSIQDLFERRLAAFESDPESAKALTSDGTVAMPADADVTTMAAWTLVANAILNLDETFTRE